MNNLGSFVSLLGALAGVALGAWLTGRGQQRVLLINQRAESTRARQAAYVEFLATHRNFRRFLMTEPVAVRLDESAGYPEPVPIIDGAGRYWEAAEASYARLQILAGGTPVDEAAHVVSARSVYDVARARWKCSPGAVPQEVLRAARLAEDTFAEAAHRDLRGAGDSG